MNLPFFYIKDYDPAQDEILLDEETSKHVVQVLRMKSGEPMNLTDGKGTLLTAKINDPHKKHCSVRVTGTTYKDRDARKVTVAVSILKNSNRFEWFLEKAGEIGVYQIIPMICEKTEKHKIREDRMQTILISAMLQSQQVWLPVLSIPVSFKKVTEQSDQDQKFIAHCREGAKRNLADLVNENLSSQIILIGPEGDFTEAEIELAVENHFMMVELGNTRLRTETAGIVAAVLLCRS